MPGPKNIYPSWEITRDQIIDVGAVEENALTEEDVKGCEELEADNYERS